MCFELYRKLLKSDILYTERMKWGQAWEDMEGKKKKKKGKGTT